MALNCGDNRFQFIGSDPLAIIFAVFASLQEVVRALSHSLAAALNLIGLLADVAADHAVDLSHFFEDMGTFLLEGN